MLYRRIILIFTSITLVYNLQAQSSKEDSIRLPAGPQYAASGWKQFWWGKHWRDEWLQPVSFPLFNLDTTAGGLTAIKRGGGHETKTLRLMGANGREYVLRTIDKNLDLLIPDQFKGSFLNDIVNDQISTAHPYGPIVIASLSASIHILHTNPVFAYVPDNPRLKEFRSDFAGKLCLFEERPSGDGWDNQPLTGYSSGVINSDKLFENLSARNNLKVDQSSLLKIRLFDMVINDFDRHEDQWVWTEFKSGGRTIYKPFARDRDQAFSKTDGVNLFLLSLPWTIRSLQNFDPTLGDVIGSNLSSFALDRQFLTELSEQQWRDTIQSLQQQLTDSAIKQAVDKLPPEISAISGSYLFKRLRQRRDNMDRYGMKYYRVLNRQVTVAGSDKKEFYFVSRPDRNHLELTISTEKTDNKPSDTIYHRLFDKRTTRSVTLYGLGGDDEFIVNNMNRNGIRLRLLGGEGSDIYRNMTREKVRQRRIRIYDNTADRNRESGRIYRTENDTSFTNFKRRSFRYDWWSPLLVPAYNPDDGVFVGLGFTYKRQQWNRNPFGWQQTISGSYAAATGAYSFFYKGLFKRVISKKWDIDLSLDYKAPTYIINFYGYGNETSLGDHDKDFFRFRASNFTVMPGISRSWKYHYFFVSPTYSAIRVTKAENKFINLPVSGIDSSVYKTNQFSGIRMLYKFHRVNNEKYPTTGFHFEAGPEYILNLKKTRQDYFRFASSVSVYFSLLKNITVAHRTGTAFNIGDYEFYQANSLGGLSNLRGYWRSRFTGQTIFYQNSEIRWKIKDFNGYVVRGRFGIYGFFDDGRVWIKSENSDQFHTGFGGGVFFIPYQTLAINFSVASSSETNVFAIRTGFLF